MTLKEEAEQRFEIYAFFSWIFMEPIAVPGAEFTRSILSVLEAMLKNPEGAPPYFRAYYEETLARDAEEAQKELAVDRTYLCRGVRPNAGFMPPYESYYSDIAEHEVLLLVLEHYRKGGLDITRGIAEKPDYIGLELAFMAELCRKELESPRKRKRIRQEEKLFLTKHLGKWAPAYLDNMEKYAKTLFFKGVAVYLRDFLAEETAGLTQAENPKRKPPVNSQGKKTP